MAEALDRPLLVSVPTAAKMLGIARNKAYDWCRRGIIPHARDGNRIYIPTRALENLAASIEDGSWQERFPDSRTLPASGF